MSDDDTYDDDDIESDIGFYEGERDEDGNRHGFGTAHLPNGDIYEGQYVRGKRQGKGVYKFHNGAKYEGDYFAGNKHGLGTMTYPDGSKYEGSWENNTKHGQGIYAYINGDIYDGFWVEDQKHGRGVYKNKATNAEISGKWEDGILHGPVKIYYDGYYFKGRYNDNLLHGKGKFTFPLLGVEQVGQYVITKIVAKKTDEQEDEGEYFVKEKLSIWRSTATRPIYDEEEEVEMEQKPSSSSRNMKKSV
ncbi:radial spoke head 1 homolog [Rhopilema esculentum]|uniref:radial spoke head 1 homolog n=1 Tax=Rhopilema esculentum TaxID=499914 RepID=UPI0031CE66C9|eukprot:gene16464-7879_t